MVAKEEALQLLRSLGVREISESGSFKVAPRKYEMVRYKVLRERRYSIITPAKIFFLLSQRPMFICLFGFEPWCWVRKFKDPVIDFLINAIAVDDVHVYVLRGLITGKIVTNFFNKSKEGETWEENVLTGEQRNRTTVEGSADLSGKFREIITMQDINENLADVENVIERTKPEAKIEIETGFEKRGYIELIKSILSLLLTGRIYVNDYIKVKVAYSWLGENRVVEKDIAVRAYLPVRSVSWHLW